MNLQNIIRQLLSEKLYTVVKLISLTLGLALGITLISKLHHSLSSDKFWKDSDRIYRIKMSMTSTDNDKNYESFIIMGAIAPMMAESVPSIEFGVTTSRPWSKNLKYGDNNHMTRFIYSYPELFDILSINVLQGSKESLKIENNIIISSSLKRRIFKDSDPIGEKILYDGLVEYTVTGVFEDINENSHLKADAIGSFENIAKQFGMYTGLGGGDSFWGYIKLRDGINADVAQREANEILAQHPESIAAKEAGWLYHIFIIPITQSVTGDPEFRRMAWIIGIVGFAVILISIINYILISVASVVNRSKSIGIRKTNGAMAGDIFKSFIIESALILFVALILSILIQYGINMKLSEIYNIGNSWTIIAFILLFLLGTSYLPARILSRLPVRSTLAIKTPNFIVLKQSLMFFLFIMTSLLISLLIIATLQYNKLINKDIGYNYSDKAVVSLTNMTNEKYNVIRSELNKLTFVEEVSRTELSPIYGLSGFPIVDPQSGKTSFSARYMACDKDYINMMEIKIIDGDNSLDTYVRGQYIVNETLLKMARISGNPVGQTFRTGGGERLIVGVAKDFNADALYTEQQPLVITVMDPDSDEFDLTIKMNPLSQQNMQAANEVIKQVIPHHSEDIITYRSIVEHNYEMVHNIRNIIVIASLVALFIALLGIISYMSDEIIKKGKEIAIRKINGATSSNVVRLLSKRIFTVATISVIIGSVGAYLIGGLLLQNFAYRISLSIWIFIVSAAILYFFLFLTLFIQTYRIANENPVKTIVSQE